MLHINRFGYGLLALGIATTACTSEVSTTRLDDSKVLRRAGGAPIDPSLTEDAAAPVDQAPAPVPVVTPLEPVPAPPPDQADGGVQQDASVGPCVTDNDCTTFSSYCRTDPCKCFGQRRGTSMTCNGGIVSCFRDPCIGEVAVCVAGQCVL